MTNNYRKLHGMPMCRKSLKFYRFIINNYYRNKEMTWDDIRKLVRGEWKDE